MLIIRGFESGKVNALSNLISHQQDIDRTYFFSEDLCEPKHQLSIKKLKNPRIKYCNYPKDFIEYSNTMDDVYNNINNYSPKRNRKTLIVFDGMTASMSNNKKIQSIVEELLTRCRKLNISLAFVTQSYLLVPKEVILNSTYYRIMKIYNEELQKISTNHSADIDYKYFMNIYRKCRSKPFHYLI